MALQDRPRETLGPDGRPAAGDRGALDAAAATRRAREAERLGQAKDRMVADVRTRPEDSSAAIRRLLGYDDAPRPPQRWEQAIAWGDDGVRLRNVHVGPVDPAPRRARPAPRRARP